MTLAGADAGAHDHGVKAFAQKLSWAFALAASLVPAASSAADAPRGCVIIKPSALFNGAGYLHYAAIASECKILAHPASVDTIPTDGSKEDVVPMAMGAATKLRKVVRNLEYVLAIELMCAAQGIDCRRPLKAGVGVEKAYATVRKLVAPLKEDRVLGPDIEAIADAIAAGAFA